MVKWEFDVIPPNFVQQDPTQRDQFNNEDVGLSEALVREVIQNSSDAGTGAGPVKVAFSVQQLDPPASAKMRSYFLDLRPHLDACGIATDCLNAANANILLIEDFATKGLTGKIDSIDKDNFRGFWRVHGGSQKGGASGGRWGLGKLVYSSSSEVRAFFGLTIRTGETSPYLMGQAVLRAHEIAESHYPAHGFWFSERGPKAIQLPISSVGEIDAFRRLTGVLRQTQPGLSIVVPYIKPNITNAALLDAVLRNYYFPILAGKLTVEVGSTRVDKDTFHEVAAANAKSKANQAIPLSFVESVSSALSKQPEILALPLIGSKGLTEKNFQPADFEKMKSAFRDGKLVQVRLPLTLRSRLKADITSYVDLFLLKLPEGERPFALFARGSITVPGEGRWFAGVQAYGAMVAHDVGVAEFLGDAENPAHTSWSANAEKLAERWTSTTMVPRIRHALKELHTLIAEQVAREDQFALLDLFSIIDQSRAPAGRKKRNKRPEIDAKPKEKAINIKPCKGGFQVVAGPGAAKWNLPKQVRIRVAYDTMVGNPFKGHSKHDFDLTKTGIAVEAKGAEVTTPLPNVIVALIKSHEFVVSGTGFDANRDIVVDARAS